MPDLQYRKVQLQYKCCRIRDFLSINSWWVNSWINSFGMDRYGMCPLEQPKLERLPLLCSKEWFLKSYWVAIEAICGPALERELQRTGTDIYSVRSISIVWIVSLSWGFPIVHFGFFLKCWRHQGAWNSAGLRSTWRFLKDMVDSAWHEYLIYQYISVTS